MIIDDTGRLIWFSKTPRDEVATDFRVQDYRGKPVLTWWQGGLIVGDGRGVGMIYDQRYRRVTTVRAANGYSMDLHEFAITPKDTALMIAFDRIEQDLRALGGPRRGVVIAGDRAGDRDRDRAGALRVALARQHRARRGQGAAAQEGRRPVRLHPHELGRRRCQRRLHPVGAQHLGRLQGRSPDRAARLAARRHQAVVQDGATGRSTAWQHDARPLADGDLLVYDNGASPQVHETSRALTLRVDEQGKTAKVVRELKHPRKKLLSATQGGAEPLPNGNTFVGWGSQRYFSEYDAEGKLVFDAEFARGNDNYRAYRLPWEGRPAERPKVVASGSGGTVTRDGELERRDRGRPLAAPGRPERGRAGAGGRREADGVRDHGQGRRPRARLVAHARARRRRRDAGTSPAVPPSS